MSLRPPEESNEPSPAPRTPLPDLSVDVVTRLVAGRCYWIDLSLASLRTLMQDAHGHGAVVVPAGCEADLRDQTENFTIQGPFLVGTQLVTASASIGPSEPFDAETLQSRIEGVESGVTTELEQRIIKLGGPAEDVGEGVFLCNTGPLSTGTLVFGVAGTRDEADTLGGEYVWGHDLQGVPHDEGVIGEVVASVDQDGVAEIDFGEGADHLRRTETLPFADDPVYFLVAQYD